MNNSTRELSDVGLIDSDPLESHSADIRPKCWACLIHSLNGGGAERVMSRLVGELADRGHEVHLITLDDGENDRYSTAECVHRHSLNLMKTSRGPISGWMNHRWRVRIVRKTLRQIAPDTVLSFCDRNNILSLMAARGTGIPVVVSERSDPQRQSMGRFWDWMRIRTYRHAETIVAQTERVADFLRDQTGREVIVIPSAVDGTGESVEFDSRWKRRTIVGVGRYEFEKGFDRLIAAFAKLAPKHPDWKLRLVGDGSLRSDLEQQRDKIGLTDRIIIDEWQNPIDAVYRDASLFALASRYEGFPAALLEAMAAGLPVVAVRCPSGPEAIIRSVGDGTGNLGGSADGGPADGVLVKNDTDSLAAGLDRIMGDAELARALGQQATKVSDRFGWPSMVLQYENALINGSL